MKDFLEILRPIFKNWQKSMRNYDVPYPSTMYQRFELCESEDDYNLVTYYKDLNGKLIRLFKRSKENDKNRKHI